MSDSFKKKLLFAVTLALMGGTVLALTTLKTRQRLGEPGLIATPETNSLQMQFDLPAKVSGFTSTNLPEPDVVLNLLPEDTSYAQRRYIAPDGAWAQANIILMGGDRTSIHRAEYCLPGQGWKIIKKEQVKLSIAGPHPYEMPVQKWIIHNTFADSNGQQQEISGMYVFWFVTQDQITDSYSEMLLSTLFHQLTSGVLQRWAYVSWFTLCEPGQEDATFARLKPLITAAVPEFQRPPHPAK